MDATQPDAPESTIASARQKPFVHPRSQSCRKKFYVIVRQPTVFVPFLVTVQHSPPYELSGNKSIIRELLSRAKYSVFDETPPRSSNTSEKISPIQTSSFARLFHKNNRTQLLCYADCPLATISGGVLELTTCSTIVQIGTETGTLNAHKGHSRFVDLVP